MRLAAALAAAVALVASACSGGSPEATRTPSPTAASTAPTSETPRATPTPATTPAPPSTPAGSPTPSTPSPATVRIALSPFADGFDAPVLVTNAGDGSGNLYVVEQRGVVKLVSAGGAVRGTFLDLRSRVRAGGERGLLGLAFHPGYRSNGRLFVNYTNRGGDTVVAELSRSSATRADPGSHRILLTIEQPYANHNGGMLAFDPNGFLVIGTGDGGSGGDPQNNAQDPSTLLGKLLRIDVDGAEPYGIPDGNPYTGRAGRDEILAIGLRNPWRFAYDAESGGLFVADVGQQNVEEVNARPAAATGDNYGWRIMEGNRCFRPSSGCNRSGLVLPVATYTHAKGCSITGGVVYRGARYPALDGQYFYGDYCSGRIWMLDAGRALRGSGSARQMLDTDRSISSFGLDEAGEAYVVDIGGSILRIRAR